MSTKSLAFAFAASLLAFTGCAELGLDLPAQPVAAYRPANFRGDPRLPGDLQRVVLLPAHGGAVAESETASAMDSVLLQALQRQLRFEVVSISREECRRLFGTDSVGSTEALPPGLLEKLASLYAADAVMFTDLTTYEPYRPLSVGFRAKLATTHGMRLVWAFDEIFSASQPAMLASVREFYAGGDRSSPVDAPSAALQSPSRFGAVAADLMYRTLPPR